MTQGELDRLVAQIGEEILARVPGVLAGPRAVAGKAAELGRGHRSFAKAQRIGARAAIGPLAHRFIPLLAIPMPRRDGRAAAGAGTARGGRGRRGAQM